MRKFISLPDIPSDFEDKLLAYAAQQEVACVLKSNRVKFPTNDSYSMFEWCVALDVIEEIKNTSPAFDTLKDFYQKKNDWLFGFLTYDLKNQIENLDSNNYDGLDFHSVHFFQPKYLFLKNETGVSIGYLTELETEKSIHDLLEEINSVPVSEEDSIPSVKIKQRVNKKQYIENVNKIKQHIQRGDIYEMNYCVEFFATDSQIKAEEIYDSLNEISPMPFSCYYKNHDQYLMCASPERFIAKRRTKIISQPIKGTAKRGRTNEEDERIKLNLRNDSKEQSENVMIVDLVRNDLSRTAAKGSVKVEELFGIYSFRQLHQMISTVVSEVSEKVHWTDVIKNAFPMGSMTGAPKIRAMQLIEEFESTKRGLYSGAVGYVTPDGDFDFNVVIRSILYNQSLNYLSFMVGSAITINSDAEKEYDECLLKAKAMMQVLQINEHEKVS